MLVLIGSVTGFGLNLFLTPAISRLYTPREFGFFAALTAVASIFVGLSTFRLEVLAQKAEAETEAEDLFRSAVASACCWGFVLTLIAGVLVASLECSPWWLVTGPLVTIASLQLVGSAVLTRSRNYRTLGISNFTQGAGIGILHVILGWSLGGVSALIAGFASSRLIWLAVLSGRRPAVSKVRHTWSRSKRFAIAAGGSAFINSCAGQLPILLCFFLFGSNSVGFLAMAIRVLVAPLGVIGQAAASASIGEIGRLLREGKPGSNRVVSAGMRDLLCVGILPCVAAAAFGAWVVPVVLGPAWTLTGVMVTYMSLGTLAQFVVAPSSQLLNLTGRSGKLLLWDVVRFVVVAACFGATSILGGSVLLAIGLHSAASFILYLWLGRMVQSAVGSFRV